jgi:hypothetical protein
MSEYPALVMTAIALEPEAASFVPVGPRAVACGALLSQLDHRARRVPLRPTQEPRLTRAIDVERDRVRPRLSRPVRVEDDDENRLVELIPACVFERGRRRV